jgi:cytochrome c oxidase cbb3-type subunit 3
VSEHSERGRDVYNFRCYFCHGFGGDGKTVAASYLDPPPRDFTRTAAASLSREAMIDAVTRGRPGTAMMAFGSILGAEDIAAVVDFIRAQFMQGERRNTRYHTVANGWPDHDRYRAAFPFVTGEASLAEPVEALSEELRVGRALFMGSCVTCHDKGSSEPIPLKLNPRSISFPRGGYSNQRAPVEAVSGASPYGLHERPPQIGDVPEELRTGAAIFQKNCSFCHGADGSGKNWIGSFLQPHPRDLASDEFRRRATLDGIRAVIASGLPGTTMSAWKDVLAPQEIDATARYVLQVFVQRSVPASVGR